MPLDFRHQLLPNGLTVIAEPRADAHTAAVGFFVRTGTRDETADVMGVSHFLEHMMFKGTARRTCEAINRELDEIGANCNAYTSHDQTVYYAQVLPEFLGAAVDLLGDILRPTLGTEDFELEKNVILEEIGMHEDWPQSRLFDLLFEKYFGAHPMGFRVLGTLETIGALQAGQMRGYFEQRYGPDNIIVAAAGKVDFDLLVEQISRIAGAWKPTGAGRSATAPTPTPGVHSKVDEKVNRAYVVAAAPGPQAQDDRRYAAGVLAYILGGSDGSLLHWALVDPALADEASFGVEALDHLGLFTAWASCDPDRLEEVERILFDVIDSAVSRITADDVERAKSKIATGATLAGERPMSRMMGLGGTWFYLHRYVSLEEEMRRVTALTLDDLRSLVRDMPLDRRTVVRLRPGGGA